MNSSPSPLPGLSSTPYSLTSIDDTISRSRQVVQESIELTKRNAQRKQLLEERMQSFMEKHQDIQKRETQPLEPVASSVDAKVRELEKKLKNEEYLKQGYERAVAELKERLKDLEGMNESLDSYRMEIAELRNELTKEREWRNRFSEIEQTLNQRISEQDNQISLLETQLRAKDSELLTVSSQAQERDALAKENEALTSTLQDLQVRFESVSEERKELSGLKDGEYLSTLHKELTLQRRSNEDSKPDNAQISELERKMTDLERKYTSQMEYSRELQNQLRQAYEPTSPGQSPMEGVMKSRSRKIEELEEQLRTSSGKYEQMKRQITAPASFHKTQTRQIDSPRHAKAKKSEEAQSFRAYSIREDAGLPPKKPNKRSKSVEKRCKVCLKQIPETYHKP